LTNEIFDPKTADSLGGPDWLADFHSSAAATAAAVAAPTPEQEGWRYSRVDSVSAAGYQPILPGVPGEVPDSVAEALAAIGEVSGHVVCVDGQLVDVELSDDLPAGVVVGPATSAADVVVGDHSPPDAFAAWNAALCTAPLVIAVPRGVDVPTPIVVFNHITTAGSAVFPRLVVKAAENSSVSVLEVNTSSDVEALVVPVTEFLADRASRIAHTVVQDLGSQMNQIAYTMAEVGQEATWKSAVAAIGGDYARQRIDARLVGRGSTGTVAATYLGAGSQMIDLRTFQEHIAQDTTSELYFKGALSQESHSVYTGMARIHSEARGSSADQSNRVIKLSNDAWAESVPNLEIHNNDVRCAHASAVGPVDPDQLFYLQSRGVPTKAAERLIVGGFFNDALDHFPVEHAVALVSGRIREELDREVAELGSQS
jgi:Fe-S cluster assembly protein SufD